MHGFWYVHYDAFLDFVFEKLPLLGNSCFGCFVEWQYHVITTQTETYKKKVCTKLPDLHSILLLIFVFFRVSLGLNFPFLFSFWLTLSFCLHIHLTESMNWAKGHKISVVSSYMMSAACLYFLDRYIYNSTSN